MSEPEPTRRSMRKFFVNFAQAVKGDSDRSVILEIPSNVHHALVMRPQHERNYERNVSIVLNQDFLEIKKSWTHKIVLGGESPDTAKRFLSELKTIFETGPISTEVGYQESIDRLLNMIAERYFPGKEFWSPTFRVHELRYKYLSVEVDESKRATIKFALTTGAPLEFGYLSNRPDWHGVILPQVHVRRVNVRSVDDDGFTATHRRGFRRYSFAKVQWALMEGTKALEVLHEPMIEIEMKESKTGHQAMFSLGRVSDAEQIY